MCASTRRQEQANTATKESSHEKVETVSHQSRPNAGGGTQFSITNATSGRAQFYRLNKPQLGENFRARARLLHQNQIMKTTLLLILSTLWRSPKKHFLTLLLILCVWPGASTARAQAPGAVAAWGDNTYGQTTMPVGLSGVTAIAAEGNHTVALKNDGTVVAWGDDTYGQTAVPQA